MELYDLIDPTEKILADRAAKFFWPIGGTMELTPMCNMNCKMCYIRLTREQMEKEGQLLELEQWLRIAEDARNSGVLYLLITGGEPLIYPDFEKLYTALAKMGFIISINTNGTLLDEKWVKLFAEYPCRRINITLYGKDDETYERLCGQPDGFTRVKRAADLLKENNIQFHFTCSVTPQNRVQIEALHQVARHYGVDLSVCHYRFPPVRKGFIPENYQRMTPEDAAAAIVENCVAAYPEQDIVQIARNTIEKTSADFDCRNLKGFNCNAGRTGFWINWKGEMQPCGLIPTIKKSLLHECFVECWRHIVRETQRIKRSPECDTCRKFPICKSCVAACMAESGASDRKPEYQCRMVDEELRLCKEIIKNNGWK